MPEPRPSIFQRALDAAGGEASKSETWAPFLDIKLVNGNHFAIRNGNLLWMDFVPPGKLVLRFSTHTLRLEGIGLEPLHQELLKLHCKQITAVDRRYVMGDEPGPLVVEVEIERKPGGPDWEAVQ